MRKRDKLTRFVGVSTLFWLAYGCMRTLGVEDLDYHLECEPGERRCVDRWARICKADGVWNDIECIGQMCLEGECVSLACKAGEKGCDGNTPLSCGADGQWMSGSPCIDQSCSQGVCSGVCELGALRCMGNIVQSCDVDGQWVTTGICSFGCGGGICQRSCAGSESTCGIEGKESCCTSILVPGGTYKRSNDPAYPAAISPFRLDRYELTVDRFRRFVEAYPGSKPTPGAGAHPKIASSGWNKAWDIELPENQAALVSMVKCSASYQTWKDQVGTAGDEHKPMNCITWYEAFAFCAWDGGRLPTEAEWNYAAAGGDEQRRYPWSNPPDSSIVGPDYAVYECLGDGNIGTCSFLDIMPVGSKSKLGDGKWGHADLGGNAMEWTLDWFSSYGSSCDDCANIVPGTTRVPRGGGWMKNEYYMDTTLRHGYAPWYRYDDVGVRCARDL